MPDDNTRSDGSSRAATLEKLRDLIADIRVCMLTTATSDGDLHSRPMVAQQEEFDGTLWFFTGAGSNKIHEIQEDQHVNLSFADPAHDQYVSISGRARMVRDRAKIDQLWKPMYKAWFPRGKDDPDIALLHVRVNEAEYWDPASSRMLQLIGAVTATLTGRPAPGGEHQRIDFLGEVH